MILFTRYHAISQKSLMRGNEPKLQCTRLFINYGRSHTRVNNVRRSPFVDFTKGFLPLKSSVLHRVAARYYRWQSLKGYLCRADYSCVKNFSALLIWASPGRGCGSNKEKAWKIILKILGVHDGHGAGAAVVVDGVLVAAASEERFSRIKNDAGYPRRAVEAVLETAGILETELDTVALGTKFMHRKEFYSSFDWYRKGYSQQISEEEQSEQRSYFFLIERQRERKQSIVDHLHVDPDTIEIVEHHEAHAATALYGSDLAYEDRSTLILTLDGSGDGICATVSIGSKGDFERIASTPGRASLGKIFSRVTFLMGMKPWEHEYKVMGLAPYADSSGVKRSKDVMAPLIEVKPNSLEFSLGGKISANYCYEYLRESLENHRFDWIAGAAQEILEELVIHWVKNCIATTGIRRIVCAGGVFMNVKMNMLISNLDGLEDVFFFPSGGDESICIGAAFRVAAQSGDKVSPIGSIYLGPETMGEDLGAIVKNCSNSNMIVTEPLDINQEVAEILTKGEVVARWAGRMEFGARALGNRSILADPSDGQVVHRLNSAIKKRDFWMPFAPTIMSEYQNDYLVNPNRRSSPHMILAFETKSQRQHDLTAAMHPYDRTVRPQILEKSINPEYWDLIDKFRKITGIGGVLNTSFNIHGEPIVCRPSEAVDVFERSGLQHLALDRFLISKPEYGNP